MLRQRWRALLPLVASALLAAMLVAAWKHLAGQRYIDFYNPWAVTLGHRALGGNPYADGDAYSRFADAIADTSGSASLRTTNVERRLIDPTATPLFYTLFAWVPRDFDLAYGIMAALLVAALLGSVAALASMRGFSTWAAWALAAAAGLLYLPFEVDLRVGNVNALQLAAIVALVLAARNWREEDAGFAQELYLPALVLLVLFKPNIALVAGALAIQLACVRGARAVARGTLLGLGAAGLAYAGSCLHFGSASVWRQWWTSLHDANGGTMLYASGTGNASLAKLLSERYGGIDPYLVGLVLGVLLALFLAASFTACGKDTAGASRRWRRWASDPAAMASTGILLTFAMSPLVWPHYEVLALVPVFYALSPGRLDAAAILVALSCVMLSRPLAQAFDAGGMPSLTYTMLLLGWLPLAAALCLRAARDEG